MIALSRETAWRAELRDAIRSGRQLCDRLEIPFPAADAEACVAAERDFPVLVPPFWLGKMRRGDPQDPLFLQTAAQAAERSDVPGFSADPVGEASHGSPALLQKYAGRALLMPTSACAVHCRYCFRRHFPYAEHGVSTAGVEAAIATVAADPSLTEIILSGGDPLTLSDGRLSELVRQLADIPHLSRLRIHSRLPIVIPSRVTDAMLGWLTGTRLTPVFVLHANHPREICEVVADAVGQLVSAGVPVLNQAVLLRGINDDADTLTQLCERLVNNRVMPYYLHQLDRVTGAAHFEVSEQRGLELMHALRSRLPGYAVPRYVREVPGQPAKSPL